MPECPTCREEVPSGASECPRDGTPIPNTAAVEAASAATVLGSDTPPPPSEPGPARKGTQARVAPPSHQPMASGGPKPQLDKYLKDEPIKIIPGTMVGEYEVAYKLGEGGMGQVFAAVHPIIGKRVAVKVLADHVASNREVVRRFVAEARAVNQIGHRNIVDVFAFGQLEDGREYYVMEHLNGRSLQEEMEAVGRMTPEQIVEFMLPTLDALQAAHDAGIIHRDLKPDNLFLAGDPDSKREVRLLDFGIAKLSGEESALTRTRTGVAMGTPDFMSPEQCRGSGVDHRTDIYALGMILYEMFTGVLPFKGTGTMELFFKQINDPPPPPSTVVPISSEFEQIILTCIEKDPDNRFQSARALAEALEAALEKPGEVVHAESPPAEIGEPAADAAEDGIEPADEAEAEAEEATEAPVAAPTPTADAIATPTPAKSGSPVLLIGLGLLVAVGGGVGAFVLLSDGDAGADGPTEPPVAVVAADAAPEPPPVVAPPDAAEAVEPGSLTVKTNVKNAEVLIDGKPVGKGKKVVVPDLQPGSYLVEVRRRRYKTIQRPVEIASGADASEVFVLERKRRNKPDDDDDDVVGPDPLDDKDGTIDVFGNKKKKTE